MQRPQVGFEALLLVDKEHLLEVQKLQLQFGGCMVLNATGPEFLKVLRFGGTEKGRSGSSSM